jgi:hypothetical protein
MTPPMTAMPTGPAAKTDQPLKPSLLGLDPQRA